MVNIHRIDLDNLRKVLGGKFGMVYQKDDKIAYKVYYPTVYDYSGIPSKNPALSFSKGRLNRLIEKSKKLEYTGGVLDLIAIDGDFGGVVIPYYDGITLSNMMDSSYKLKVDLSRQFVRNSKELIRHNIYPLDYKLNNLMCENGELRIIDLDDFHTKVCRIPNPILSKMSTTGMCETIHTFFREYNHMCLPNDILKQLERPKGRFSTTYDTIDSYIDDKSIPRKIIVIDSSTNLLHLRTLLEGIDYQVVYQIEEELEKEDYQRIIDLLNSYGIPLYDFVTSDSIKHYDTCENIEDLVTYDNKVYSK